MRFLILRKHQIAAFALLVVVGASLFFILSGRGLRQAAAPAAGGRVTVVRLPDREAVRVPRKDNFFVDYRLDREINRSRQLELLREIAADKATDEATRKRVQERLLLLSEQMGKEARLEKILEAKGFREAIVVLEEEGVTVIVPGPVDPEKVNTITALVYHTLGVPQEQVVTLGREGQD